MFGLGLFYACVFWCLAAVVLSEFEMHVFILRPWMRTVYGIFAFTAGVLLIWVCMCR